MRKKIKRNKYKDNIIIEADFIIYNKLLNILEAKGNVIVEDKFRKYNLYTDYLKYFRNENIIKTDGNSKAIDLKIIVKFLQKNLNTIWIIIRLKRENVILNNVSYNLNTDYLEFLEMKI